MLFALTGCIKESLDECKTGDIEIKVYVEKFQATSEVIPDDMEASFDTRIKNLRYYLYQGNMLLEQGTIDDLSGVTGPDYIFRRTDLAFGSYTLALVGNGTDAVLEGSPDQPGGFLLVYPEADRTDDYFTAVFPFTVDCQCVTYLETALQRAHGVVRFHFVNLPPRTVELAMTLEGVSGAKQVTGGFTGSRDVTYRIPVGALTASDTPQAVIGTFPTANGGQTVYRLALYGTDPQTPFYNGTVSDNVPVKRNQLTDVLATFTPEGDINVSIELDKEWDGSLDGGGTDID